MIKMYYMHPFHTQEIMKSSNYLPNPCVLPFKYMITIFLSESNEVWPITVEILLPGFVSFPGSCFHASADTHFHSAVSTSSSQ